MIETSPPTRVHSRAAILKKLRGETLAIQGLQSAFDGWEFAVNPALEDIRKDVDEWLTSEFPNHPKLAKLRKGDYGLFGATWWPDASFERLRIATYVAVWLFVWDDEIDSDVGSLSHDFASAQDFRLSTLGYISYSLGLPEGAAHSQCSNRIITSFKVIGDALRAAWTPEQCRTFMKEVEYFMDKSEVEQDLRLTGRLPTLEEFWRYRLGTSAVRVVLGLNEYCAGIDHAPKAVINDPAYGYLLDLTNVNICAVNDLLSVKKELKQGAVENLVAILYADAGSTEAAADGIMNIVRASKQHFDATAAQFIQQHAGDEKRCDIAMKLVRGCIFYSTGNLDWSLRTARYGIHAHEANNIVVQL